MQINTAKLKRLLNVQELADSLGVAPNTIYRLIENEGLPAKRVSNLYRFDVDEVQAWLDERSVNKPSTQQAEQAASL